MPPHRARLSDTHDGQDTAGTNRWHEEPNRGRWVLEHAGTLDHPLLLLVLGLGTLGLEHPVAMRGRRAHRGTEGYVRAASTPERRRSWRAGTSHAATVTGGCSG